MRGASDDAQGQRSEGHRDNPARRPLSSDHPFVPPSMVFVGAYKRAVIAMALIAAPRKP